MISLKRKRIFVPATVFDNRILLENDPNYLAALSSMPEAEVNALLYGDWDSFSGQVFTEWRNDPAHYDDRQWTHVINPFIRSIGGYTGASALDMPTFQRWMVCGGHRGAGCIGSRLYGCTSQNNVKSSGQSGDGARDKGY